MIGEKEANSLTDIYGLGATMFEALTGRLPFGHGLVDPNLVLLAAQGNQIDREGLQKLPLPLQEVFKKALDKDPEQRYQTAGEFAQAFRKAIS